MEFLGCNPSKKDLRNYKIRATASQIDNLPDEFELPKYSLLKIKEVLVLVFLMQYLRYLNIIIMGGIDYLLIFYMV